MNTEKCLIGTLINTRCGSHQFIKQAIDVTNLSEVDLKILKYRIFNFPDEPTGVICPSHISSMLNNYSLYQLKCSDPFNKHSAVIKVSLRDITLEMCEKFFEATNKLIPPGNKVCINCLKSIGEKINDYETKKPKTTAAETEPQSSEVCPDSQVSCVNSESQKNQPSQSDSSTGFLTESQEQQMKENKLKRILDSVNLPMPKRQRLSKRALDIQSFDLAHSVFERTLHQVNETFDTNVTLSEMKELERAKQSLDAFIANLKSLYERQTTPSEKIKILTMFPDHWTYNDFKKHVDCSKYMIRKAKMLKEKSGVFADAVKTKRTKFPEDFIDSIEDYYRENSRICSGAKECVFVKNRKTQMREKVPKKLLLSSIRELYDKYIDEHMHEPENIPGFSYFASLRPKDVKLAGDPGTHTVCVCGEHQNIKLKCRACSTSLDYRKLLDLCVCSTENENCMLNDCPNCPGSSAIQEFLETKNLVKSSGTVTYFNWLSVNIEINSNDGHQSSGRVTLREVTEDAQIFYEQLVDDIWNLRKHHFISESQKDYINYVKSTLEYDTGILMMDFAENFTFIAQDSTQAFYYNNVQATLHPFVLYYRDDAGNLKQTSFCVVSDYLKHNAYVVNLFQEKVLEIMKECFPWIKKLIYFSDGAPTQYKNKNNFANICEHEIDFGIKVVSYNFFATSHGKGPCDGIGAVAKRTVRDASLRLPPEKQILSPIRMYEYLNAHLTKTRFLWVSSDECEKRERKLKKRFDAAKTVEGTRGYHFLKPVDVKSAEFRITSFSETKKLLSILK